MNDIHIALTLTDSFWALAHTAARSICVTSREPQHMHIHICHDGPFAPAHKVELDGVATEFGAHLHYYDVSDHPDIGAMAAALRQTRRYPKIVYARLLLHRILPADIERVIYLDCDVLVLDDLTTLYNSDLEGYALGAVLDTNHIHQRLGRDLRARRHQSGQGDRWFNSGVQLQDLRRMEAADILAFAHELSTKMDISRLFFDQDLANLKFARAWKQLDWRYNVQAPGGAHLPLGPIILHFTAHTYKPWHLTRPRPYSRLYRQAMTNKVFYWQVRDRWKKIWYLRPLIGLLPRG